MGRQRGRANKAWSLPENLYINGKYFIYRNPVTGKRTSLNKPAEEAIRLAKAANAQLLPLLVNDGILLETITGERTCTFKHVLERFEKEWLPQRRYAERSLEEIKFKLARYKKDLGSRIIDQFDVMAVVEYLDRFKHNAYTKHRGLMTNVFAFAVAKGLCERNFAELTLTKPEAGKKRRRHTVEGVKAILNSEATPPWLHRTIRLALFSLQRREDIVTWLKSAVDLEQNTVKVSAGKSENYDTPIHLEIIMGSALREVIIECMTSPVVCPYLVSCIPRARRRKQLSKKLHWNAVTPDFLSKSFTKARNAAKAYEEMPEDTRPTFHELRALGSWLYEQQGFTQDYIQALMGHADVKMTEHYQAGHEEEKIEYQRVQADLTWP